MIRSHSTNISCLLCKKIIELPYEDLGTIRQTLATKDPFKRLKTEDGIANTGIQDTTQYHAKKNVNDCRNLVGRTLQNLIDNTKQDAGKGLLIKHVLAAYCEARHEKPSDQALKTMFSLQLLNHPDQNRIPRPASPTSHTGRTYDVENPPLATASIDHPPISVPQQGINYDNLEKKIVITYCGRLIHWNCLCSSAASIEAIPPGTFSCLSKEPVEPSTPVQNIYGDGEGSAPFDAVENLVFTNTHNDSIIQRYYHCTCAKCQVLNNVPFALLLTPNNNAAQGNPRLDPLEYIKGGQTVVTPESLNALYDDRISMPIYTAAADKAVYGVLTAPGQSSKKTNPAESIYDLRDGGTTDPLRTIQNKLRLKWPDLRPSAPKPSPLFVASSTHLNIPAWLNMLHALNDPGALLPQNSTVRIATPKPANFKTSEGQIDPNATFSYTDFIVTTDNCFQSRNLNSAIVVHPSCGCTTGLTMYLDAYREYRYISYSSRAGKPGLQISFCCPHHSNAIDSKTQGAPDSIVIFETGLNPIYAVAQSFGQAIAPKTAFIKAEHEAILAAADLPVLHTPPARRYTLQNPVYAKVVPTLKHGGLADLEDETTVDLAGYEMLDGQGRPLLENEDPPYLQVAGHGPDREYDNALGAAAAAAPDQPMYAAAQVTSRPLEGAAQAHAKPNIVHHAEVGPLYSDAALAMTMNPATRMYENPAYDQNAANARFIKTPIASDRASDRAQAPVMFFIISNPDYNPLRPTAMISATPEKSWFQLHKRRLGLTALGVGVVATVIAVAASMGGQGGDSGSSVPAPDPTSRCDDYTTILSSLYNMLSLSMPQFSSNDCRQVFEVLTPIINRVNTTFASNCTADFYAATDSLNRNGTITTAIATQINNAFDAMIVNCPAPCFSEVAAMIPRFNTITSGLGLVGYNLLQTAGLLAYSLPNGTRIPAENPQPFLDATTPALVSYANSNGFPSVTTAQQLANLDAVITTNLNSIQGLGVFPLCEAQLVNLNNYITAIKNRLTLLNGISTTLSTMVTSTAQTPNVTTISSTTAAVTATLSASPTSLVTGTPTSAPTAAPSTAPTSANMSSTVASTVMRTTTEFVQTDPPGR